ncbi:MAG: hypothetical protein ACTSO9_07095 [Candidatus Helarchaeota archaeon]
MEEKINKLEKALEEVKARLDKVEQKLGVTAEKPAGKSQETLAAPIPAPVSKKEEPRTSSSTSGIQPVVKKRQIIKQTLPRF